MRCTKVSKFDIATNRKIRVRRVIHIHIESAMRARVTERDAFAVVSMVGK